MSDSFFKRTFELTKLTVQVGLKELGAKDIKTRIEQAKLIAESLSELKGAAMKAGQLLSIELDDYLPPEAIQVLSQLQSQGTSTDFKTIHKILVKEIGEAQLKKIEGLSQKPVASASIAQIHTGYYNSEKVAIKVQHPGVSKTISSDIALLKKISQAFCKMTNRKMNLTPVFNEMKEVLNQEVQFSKELSYLLKYKKKLEKLRFKYGQYKCPTPIESLCTDKVMVMSWEEGLTIHDWLLTQPSMEMKEKLAHMILNLYCREFYSWGLVQTDPNYANFLIHQKGSQIELVVLDFGATREYSRQFVKEYTALLDIVRNQETDEKIIEAGINLALIDKKESQESKQLFIELMNVAVEPFLQENKKFSFGDKDYNTKSKKVIKDFVASLKYSPPPYKLLFLHRKLGGVSALLRRLEVKIDVTDYWYSNYLDGE